MRDHKVKLMRHCTSVLSLTISSISLCNCAHCRVKCVVLPEATTTYDEQKNNLALLSTLLFCPAQQRHPWRLCNLFGGFELQGVDTDEAAQ